MSVLKGPFDKKVGEINYPTGINYVQGDPNRPWWNPPHRYRWWYNQSRPYVDPLANRVFRSYYGIAPGRIGDLGSTMIAKRNELFFSDPTGHAAYAQAYDRFASRLGPRVQLALNALEAEKSLAMILTRVKTGLDLIRSPTRFIAQAVTSKHKRKQLSSMWLEFTFGWAPLMSDIYHGAQALSREFPITPITGAGSEVRSVNVPWDAGSAYKWNDELSYKLRAHISITNPNLALASQLGLTNPLAVAWDAIPFSFVADWFLKVNTYLNSWDAMAGVSLIRPSYSRRIQGQASVIGGPYNGTGGYAGQARVPGGFPIPGLASRWRIPSPSLWLAVTSTSLLVQRQAQLLATASRFGLR